MMRRRVSAVSSHEAPTAASSFETRLRRFSVEIEPLVTQQD
jgi:hypothetical protein